MSAKNSRTMNLVLTLKKAMLLKAAQRGTRYDIEKMISDVPSATVVSGNPAVSVQIRVADKDIDRLRQSVGASCTIDQTTEFELFKTAG